MEEKYLKYVNEFNDGDFDSLLPFFDRFNFFRGISKHKRIRA